MIGIDGVLESRLAAPRPGIAAKPAGFSCHFGLERAPMSARSAVFPPVTPVYRLACWFLCFVLPSAEPNGLDMGPQNGFSESAASPSAAAGAAFEYGIVMDLSESPSSRYVRRQKTGAQFKSAPSLPATPTNRLQQQLQHQ